MNQFPGSLHDSEIAHRRHEPAAKTLERRRLGVRQPSAALVFNASLVFEPVGFIERHYEQL